MTQKKRPDFETVLEEGAKIDEIFKDQPVPRGSDPYSVNEVTDHPGINIDADAVPVAMPDDASIATSADVKVDPNLESPEIQNFSAPEINLQPLHGGGGGAPDLGGVPTSDEFDGFFGINRKFAALSALLELLNKEMSFAEFIHSILNVCMEQIRSEAGSFIEVDYGNDNLFFRAVAGRSKESQSLLGITIPRGKGVVGFVCDNQQVMALTRLDETSIYLKSISDSVGFEANNLVAIPVVIRGMSFGCIELLNRVGEEKYTDSDKEVLSAISEFAAKLIENRLILAELSDRAERAQVSSDKKEAA